MKKIGIKHEYLKIIALDLDGTLLKDDKTVSARDMEALHRCLEAGKKVVIATGRAYRSAKKILPPFLQRLLCVCCDGAEIYREGEKIGGTYIPPPLARKILDRVLHAARACKITLEMDDCLYSNFDLTPYDMEFERADLASLDLKSVAKIIVDLADLPDPAVLTAHLPSVCRMYTTSESTLGQITHRRVKKSAGLASVAGAWGMSLENVIAFGDDLNDLDMIRECGLGVAMGNAVPEVLAAAGLIAKSNQEDGVADVLERLLDGTLLQDTVA
ncbi:MAG: HAD family hydrolase [Bacillota bacterium]